MILVGLCSAYLSGLYLKDVGCNRTMYNLVISARSFGEEIRRHTDPKSLDIRPEKVDKREEEDICTSDFCFLL